MMMQKITPCLWFNNQGEQAANAYISIFGGKINATTYYPESNPFATPGSVMTVEFELMGQSFTVLNGGPAYMINPAVSFYVTYTDIDELNKAWDALADGGMALMEINKYPWSERYGWIQDKFGVSWQLMHLKEFSSPQRILPCTMFIGANDGKSAEAVEFYTSIFPNSSTQMMMKYEEGEGGTVGYIKHGSFTIDSYRMVVMDSGVQHKFSLSGGISYVINCHSQAEIDFYWDKLTAGGKEIQCGWLTDKFGVTWQVVPIDLIELFMSTDKEKVNRLNKAMMEMVKLDIVKLQKAFDGE